jgi:outer membrane protein assembly factor BamE (lipoprotein component of BamABCDE complex)
MSHAPLLAATGLLAAFGAQAAMNYPVTMSQENKVVVGMTSADVTRVLGAPSATMRYGMRASTWSYPVAVSNFPGTQFEVDFGADGKVISAGEMVEQRGN